MAIKIGLIGAGGIGATHIKIIQEMKENMLLVAVADINEVSARKLAPEGAKIYTDYHELLGDARPDAVVVALPHHLHKDATINSLKAGCHVYVEKPMAISVDECNQMIEVAEKYHRSLFVGHTMRYFPENIAAYQMVRSGKIGGLVWGQDMDIAYYSWEKRKPWHLDPKQAGGGFLPNRGVHQIDRLQFFFNSPVEKVMAKVGSFWPETKVDGNFGAILIFKNGCYALVMGSGYICAPNHGTELFGVKGSIKTIGGLNLWLSLDNAPYRPCGYESAPGGEHSHSIGFKNIHAAFLKAMEGKNVDTDGYYGRSVVAVMEAICESSCKGKEVRIRES